MKKIFLIIVTVMAMGWAQAQQISLVEYFYDTDPGYGNGQTITVNAATLDGTLNFNLSGLTPGYHKVGFRLKNSNNTWGQTIWNAFWLYSGTPANTLINKVEYFWNTDAGIGSNTAVALNPKDNIDTSVLINMPPAGAGQKWLGARLFSQNGVVGNVALDTLNTCLFATAQAAFYVTQSGFKYSCVDSSKTLVNNNYAIKWYLNDVHQVPINNSKVFNLNLESQPPGNYVVKQVVGTGCQLDSTTRTIVRGGIHRILPDRFEGGEKNISMIISGGGFDSVGMVLQLVPVGEINRPFWGGNQLHPVTGQPSIVPVKRKVLAQGTLIYGDFTIPDNLMPSDTGRRLFAVRVLNRGQELTMENNLQASRTIICVYGKKYWSEMTIHDGNPDLPYYYHEWADLGPSKRDKKSSRNLYNGVNNYPVLQMNVSGPSSFRMSQTTVQNIEITNTSNTTALDVPVYVSMPRNNVQSTYYGPRWWNDNTTCGINLPPGGRCDYPENVPVDDDVDPGDNDMQYPDDDYKEPHIVVKPQDGTVRVNVRNNRKTYPEVTRLPNGQLYMYDKFDLTGLLVPKILPGQTVRIPVKVKPGPRNVGDINRRIPVQATAGTPLTLAPIQENPDSWDPFTCSAQWLKNLSEYNLNPDFRGAWLRLQEIKSRGLDVTSTVDNGSYLHNFISIHLLKGQFGANGNMQITLTDQAKANVAKIAEAQAEWDRQLQLRQAKIAEFWKHCNENKRFIAPSIIQELNTYNPLDPNYISGNSQYDTSKHWINNKSVQSYTIGFENLPTAVASAQHVFIIDTLPKKLYAHSLTLGSFRIGDSTYNLIPLVNSANQNVKIKGRNDMSVNFSAQLDTAKGIVRFDFYTMDATGQKTFDPTSLDGFLPPNNTDGIKGTGSVSFQIWAREMNTLDTFQNKASIYFDQNPPIVTNTWLNTVDTTAPAAAIQQVMKINDSTAGLKIVTTDLGSGYSHAKVYGFKNNISTRIYLGEAYGDTILVQGQPGEKWQYQIQPIDHVGNIGKPSNVTSNPYEFSGATSLGFIVYPVPAKGYFKISSNNAYQGVMLYDASGRIVKQYAANSNHTYDISSIKNGVFIVRIYQGNESKTGKLVIMN